MVKSVALKIVAHKGGHASGHTLMTTVQAMGLVEKYEAALKDAINQMLLAYSPSGEANKGNADQQLLVSILSYLTGQDWIRLEEPNSTPEQHLNVLAGRVSSLGLRNFDEQTYKGLMAIVLARHLAQHKSWPKYQVIYGWLQAFKNNCGTFKKPWNLEVLVNYPPHPRMLPSEIFAAAYPDETDPPIDKVIENFASLQSHVILRKNNNLLVKEIETERMLAMSGMATFGMPGMGGMPMIAGMAGPRGMPVMPGFANMGFGAQFPLGGRPAPSQENQIPDLRYFQSRSAQHGQVVRPLGLGEAPQPQARSLGVRSLTPSKPWCQVATLASDKHLRLIAHNRPPSGLRLSALQCRPSSLGCL